MNDNMPIISKRVGKCFKESHIMRTFILIGKLIWNLLLIKTMALHHMYTFKSNRRIIS